MMRFQFDPNNSIVKLCMQGMAAEEKGKPEEARNLFNQAWQEAGNDFEKYLGAYYVSKHQNNHDNKLKWLKTALYFALKIDSDSVRSAFPKLYSDIAACYSALKDNDSAQKYNALSKSYQRPPSDKGPFYHGTKAKLEVGDLLTAGGMSNYKSDLKMNHIYFTAFIYGAGLAASLAKGDGEERVYIVEPTGDFENDPNVTDKKFPGNPTRSYRSEYPLVVVGELTEWQRQTSEKVNQWRKKAAHSNGNIIN